MLEVFRHKNDSSFYYTRFSHRVTAEDAHQNWAFFLEHTENINSIKYITEHMPSADLVEKEYIAYMAEYALKFQNKIISSDVCGIKGYRKLFFKTFQVLSKTKFKRKLFDNLAEIEKHHHFKFEKDFEKIFEFNNSEI